MSLTFQQKLSLQDGSVVLYHEGTLQSGEPFHVLILVPGERVEEYFHFLAVREDFPVKELGGFGKILHCAVGHLNDGDLDRLLNEAQFTKHSHFSRPSLAIVEAEEMGHVGFCDPIED
jgi:hypothetical protein